MPHIFGQSNTRISRHDTLMSSPSRSRKSRYPPLEDSYYHSSRGNAGSQSAPFGSSSVPREGAPPYEVPFSSQQTYPPLLQSTLGVSMPKGPETFQQALGPPPLTGPMLENSMHTSGPLLPKAMTFPSVGIRHAPRTGESDDWMLDREDITGFGPLDANEGRDPVPYSDNTRLSRPGTYGTSSLEDHYPKSQVDPEYPSFMDHLGGPDSIGDEGKHRRKGSDKPHYSQRRTNKDEFDGAVQFLPRPPMEKIAAQEQALPPMPVNLDIREQDEVLRKVNGQLSQSAFDFIAKYQFPVPLEADKRPIQTPDDREWTEWAYLIKRLATKRRIPARVLYNGQIKQLVTILENSLEMRHASAHQSRPPKDDRNVLQLISAGIQVTKMLKDAIAMDYLDRLYLEVETIIKDRRQSSITLSMRA